MAPVSLLAWFGFNLFKTPYANAHVKNIEFWLEFLKPILFEIQKIRVMAQKNFSKFENFSFTRKKLWTDKK